MSRASSIDPGKTLGSIDSAGAGAGAGLRVSAAASSGVDRPRIEAVVRELLEAVGENPDRAELAETPRRVAESYAEFFAGVGVDPATAIGETFAFTPGDSREPVLVRGIRFRSICEHHLLPFDGVAHVAYVPHDRLIGLGRIPALIEVLSARPQLQERLGEQIADALQHALDASGVLVVLDARHGCVALRGPRQVDSTTVTVASRGTLAEPAARAELMSLIAMPGAGTDHAPGAADRVTAGQGAPAGGPVAAGQGAPAGGPVVANQGEPAGDATATTPGGDAAAFGDGVRRAAL